MAHVTRFAYDVFVSYATVDNEVLVADGRGWIDVLVDKLRRELKPRLGGRDLKMFVDHEVMRSSLPITSQLIDAVRSSATLLVVMSPGYLHSPWCDRERRAFLDVVKDRAAGSMIVVRARPVDRNRQPEEFRDLWGIDFFTSMAGAATHRLLGSPDPNERPFIERIVTLSGELAEQLERTAVRFEASDAEPVFEVSAAARPAEADARAKADADARATAEVGARTAASDERPTQVQVHLRRDPTHNLRDIEPSKDPTRAESSVGRNVIAVIGIDRYKEVTWHRLSNAVSDARGAAAQFERLGFVQATAALINERATGIAIRSLVTDELATVLGPDDTLVLFYAGHGGNRKRRIGRHDVTAGYLIPVEADAKVSSWIDLESWLREVAQLPARHILVILDACHSGIALDPVVKWRGGASDEPLAELRARLSRRIITSALGDQRAMDGGPYPGHSLFTGCLIEALTHGLRQDARCVTTGSALGEYVQRRVAAYPYSQQTPDFGTFLLDDRGELVLPLTPVI